MDSLPDAVAELEAGQGLPNGIGHIELPGVPKKFQDRQRLYNSISASSGGRRRYSAGDPRSSATLRNIASLSRSGSYLKEDGQFLPSVGEESARDPRDQADASTPPESTGSSSPYTQNPTIDLDGLSWPSRGTRARLDASPEEAKKRQDKLEGALRTILECVGEDTEREGLHGTPKRYAEAMMFFTKGYEENLRDIINGAVFHEDHDELVIVKDIEVFSLCEHHLVPFTGKIHIGYIPNKRVLGLSKLARIAEMFARRLQVQERLTKQVALAIDEVLKPKGVAVVMESSHLCMVMRGVEKTGSKTTTSCMLGCMRSRDRTRSEFLTLLDRK